MLLSPQKARECTHWQAWMFSVKHSVQTTQVCTEMPLRTSATTSKRSQEPCHLNDLTQETRLTQDARSLLVQTPEAARSCEGPRLGPTVESEAMWARLGRALHKHDPFPLSLSSSSNVSWPRESPEPCCDCSSAGCGLQGRCVLHLH